jgi:hypothetical protein
MFCAILVILAEKKKILFLAIVANKIVKTISNVLFGTEELISDPWRVCVCKGMLNPVYVPKYANTRMNFGIFT